MQSSLSLGPVGEDSTKQFIYIGPSGFLSCGEALSPKCLFFIERNVHHFLKSHQEGIGTNGVFVD